MHNCSVGQVFPRQRPVTSPGKRGIIVHVVLGTDLSGDLPSGFIYSTVSTLGSCTSCAVIEMTSAGDPSGVILCPKLQRPSSPNTIPTLGEELLAMKIKTEAISILQRFGYTEREARFLHLVAIHSGYFTQRQFAAFGSVKSGGGIVTAFTTKLVARGHASVHRYQNNAHVFHFHYKGMYSAIDREDLRNRRAHAFEYMKLRLAVLDFVVHHREHQYLDGEADKVHYFEERFQIRRQDMPGRTYRGANKDPDTIRHFIDKFPLFLDATQNDELRVTLTFIDSGTGNSNAFKTHLETYSLFLRRIPRFTFLFANPDTRTFASAAKIFRDVMDTSSTELFEQVARYFKLRRDWEAKRYGLFKNSDLEYLNLAKKRFSETYEQTFAEWKAGRLTETDLDAVIQNQFQACQDVEFKTYELPRDYSFFGENSQFTSRIR